MSLCCRQTHQKWGKGGTFKGNAFPRCSIQEPDSAEHTHNRHSCRSNSITGKFLSKASRFSPRLLSDYHLAQGSVWIRQHLASVWSIPARKDATATPQGRTGHCTSQGETGLSNYHLTATACRLIYCHVTTDYKCDLLESNILSSFIFLKIARFH